MKKIISIFIFCLVPYVAVMSDATAYVDRESAVVRIMTKAAGKARTATIPVGKIAEYEKLEILIRSCKNNDQFQAENSYAFIEVVKSGRKIFSGWQNKNEPGQNPLQDSDYDLWLINCE